jgi:DNA-binding transcriptional ArsR family regulator
MTYGAVLAALADPTRRKLFESVRHKDVTVCELAATLRITQPAVSQHLRVLKEAGLVTQRCEGARHYYRPNPKGLASLREYVDSLWSDALTAFAAEDPSPPKTRPKTRRKKGRTR